MTEAGSAFFGPKKRFNFFFRCEQPKKFKKKFPFLFFSCEADQRWLRGWVQKYTSSTFSLASASKLQGMHPRVVPSALTRGDVPGGGITHSVVERVHKVGSPAAVCDQAQCSSGTSLSALGFASSPVGQTMGQSVGQALGQALGQVLRKLIRQVDNGAISGASNGAAGESHKSTVTVHRLDSVQ